MYKPWLWFVEGVPGEPPASGGAPVDPPVDPPAAGEPKPTEKPAADTTDWKAEARKHEQRAKANAAAAKELADLKAAQMSDEEKRAAELKTAAVERDQARAEAARERAARVHKLTDDDLALLDGVPADQFAARAAALAKRIQAAAVPQQSGGEVGGQAAAADIDAQIAAAQKAGDLTRVIALKQRKYLTR